MRKLKSPFKVLKMLIFSFLGKNISYYSFTEELQVYSSHVLKKNVGGLTLSLGPIISCVILSSHISLPL